MRQAYPVRLPFLRMLGGLGQPSRRGFCPHCGCGRLNCSCGEEGSAFFPFITAPFIYSGRIKARMTDFKFGGRKQESEFFAREMSLRFAEVFPKARVDVVCAVPMTEKAKRKRGYNQSELLAKETAKRLFVPYEALLVKTRETKTQHSLKKEERLGNLAEAFAVKTGAQIRGKNVLLCDDIKTTGTTLKLCSRELLKNGAAEVYCLCAAVSDHASEIDF